MQNQKLLMKATWKISALDQLRHTQRPPCSKSFLLKPFLLLCESRNGKRYPFANVKFLPFDMWFFAIWYVFFCHLDTFGVNVICNVGNMHSSKSCDKVEHAQYFDINGKNISHLQVDIFSNFDISHIRRNGFWFVLLPAWCLEVWPWLMLGLAVMVIEKTWY